MPYHVHHFQHLLASASFAILFLNQIHGLITDDYTVSFILFFRYFGGNFKLYGRLSPLDFLNNFKAEYSSILEQTTISHHFSFGGMLKQIPFETIRYHTQSVNNIKDEAYPLLLHTHRVSSIHLY